MPDQTNAHLPHHNVYLGASKIAGAGRGVFAGRDIKKGELIETCPMVVIDKKFVRHLDKTELQNYYFEWGDDFEHGAIALGFGSLYNHSFAPNAVFKQDFDGKVIRVTALEDIGKGMEITFNYNGEVDDKTPLWIKGIN
ncbi:MAG TPA: SET domain-containing protein [Candidatus Saccharimonadia bacterium]|nr:SET domain-containing protein [Candidatus Saccharimonadia bacterium]